MTDTTNEHLADVAIDRSRVDNIPWEKTESVCGVKTFTTCASPRIGRFSLTFPVPSRNPPGTPDS